MKIEHKSIPLQVKDMDATKRTAVIAHGTFNTLDRVKDILKPGSMVKSWNESKSDIMLYFNHDDTQAPGKVLDVFEDSTHAYTKAQFGTHTLGNDCFLMIQDGIITKSSFGYSIVKSTMLKGGIRELNEIKHFETSVLTKFPAHPDSVIVSVGKSFNMADTAEFKSLSDTEQQWLLGMIANGMNTLGELVAFSATLNPDSDIYTSIGWMISRHNDTVAEMKSMLKWGMKSVDLKSHLAKMENFCRNTTASDEAVKSVLEEIETMNEIMANNTADTTSLITKPAASKGDDELKSALSLFTNALKN